jgi:hypothetical protein
VSVAERGSVETSELPAAPIRRRLPGRRTLCDGRALYWWLELVLVGAFYLVYSAIRNLKFGTDTGAYAHARQLIDFQRWLGIYHEQTIQSWALHSRAFIIAANYFYGSLHFIVTGFVMVYLYRHFTDDFPRWRNTLAAATALALIGFTFWPLMPPRLLDSFCHCATYGYVDTLAKDPAFWSFNSGAVNKISNQFAAMPSVHCAWALWCACALVPRLRRRWLKALAVVYPLCTVTVIVVTANHYVLDAAGGFLILGLGYLIARVLTGAGRCPEPRAAGG